MFGCLSLESMLSGSLVSFKSRNHPQLSEEESILTNNNNTLLGEGISLLRKLRTKALRENEEAIVQFTLKEAHTLSSKMAEVILHQACAPKPISIDSELVDMLKDLKIKYLKEDAGSGHGIPASYSITNLQRAAEDMTIRIEESRDILSKRALTHNELKYIFNELVIGTNFLSNSVIDKFYDNDTRIGGILSGGSIYTEMARLIAEKYSSSKLKIPSFIVAVDTKSGAVVAERGNGDQYIKDVILLDDMVDTKKTLLTAVYGVGKYFPNAIIHSGYGYDEAGGFEKRRTKEYMTHLSLLFQDFADFTEDGKLDLATNILREAEKYAKENEVQLTQGWYTRSKRYGITVSSDNTPLQKNLRTG